MIWHGQQDPRSGLVQGKPQIVQSLPWWHPRCPLWAIQEAGRQRGTVVLQDLTPEQMEEMVQQAMDAAGEQEGQEIKMDMQPPDSSPSPGEG